MGKVVASATMSLDGFIAYEDNSPGDLFEWYGNGDVEVTNAGELPPMRMTPPSAEHFLAMRSSLGALLVGRTLFDVTDGWHGTHPLGVPVVVLTHTPPTDWSYPGSDDFHFVTDGIEAAVEQAQRIAGEKDVGVAAGTIASQALASDLLDEVHIDLVPIVLGSGHRYFTAEAGDATRRFGDPTTVVQGRRVTHLTFAVARRSAR